MKKERTVLKIAIAAVIILASMFLLNTSVFFLLYYGAGWLNTAIFVLVFAVLTAVIIMLILAPKMLKQLYFIPIVIIFAGFALLFKDGIALYNSIATKEYFPEIIESPPDLSRYEPFKITSDIARLDALSSFRLRDILPRIDCATALYPVAAAFVEAAYPPGEYSPGDPNGILYQTGSKSAYTRLINGEVGLILAGAPSEAQLLEAQSAGVALRLTPIGKDALVFYANADNPVSGLTLGQIAGIYGGEYSNWSELGGRDEQIAPFDRAQGSASRAAFITLLGGEIAPAQNFGETPETDGAHYRNSPGAIGYSFRYYAHRAADGKLVKLLTLDGIEPSPENIRTGVYPATAKFYAVTAGDDNRILQEFINWMTSAEGQYLVEQSGYVAVNA